MVGLVTFNPVNNTLTATGGTAVLPVTLPYYDFPQLVNWTGSQAVVSTRYRSFIADTNGSTPAYRAGSLGVTWSTELARGYVLGPASSSQDGPTLINPSTGITEGAAPFQNCSGSTVGGSVP